MTRIWCVACFEKLRGKGILRTIAASFVDCLSGEPYPRASGALSPDKSAGGLAAARVAVEATVSKEISIEWNGFDIVAEYTMERGSWDQPGDESVEDVEVWVDGSRLPELAETWVIEKAGESLMERLYEEGRRGND